MHQFITIFNVIKKGGGNRPFETLATLCHAEKVLNSIRRGDIDNTQNRTFLLLFLDKIYRLLNFKEYNGDPSYAKATEDRVIRYIPVMS